MNSTAIGLPAEVVQFLVLVQFARLSRDRPRSADFRPYGPEIRPNEFAPEHHRSAVPAGGCYKLYHYQKLHDLRWVVTINAED